MSENYVLKEISFILNVDFDMMEFTQQKPHQHKGNGSERIWGSYEECDVTRVEDKSN